MDRKELEIIQDLMEELQGHMELGEDDLSERLGRKPKEVQIEIKPSIDLESELEEESEGEELEQEDEESSPDDSLKKRLMSLRGR